MGRGPVCGITTRRTGVASATGAAALAATLVAPAAASTSGAAGVLTGGAVGTAAAGLAGLATAAPAAAAGGATTTGGLAITGPAGGLLAIAGGCGGAMMGACALGCGTIRRGAVAGAATAGAAAGAAAVLATRPAVPGPAFAAVAALTTAGRAVGAGGVAFAASASACLRARMAFSASPGLEARERSMPRAVFAAVEALVAAPLGFLPEVRNSRTFEASSASIELEWVFGSVTPTAVRASRISLLFTSSSRARSLIRTLLIRLFSLPLPLAAHISLFEKGFLCFPFIIPGNRSRANRGMRFRLIFRGCPIQGFAWAGITRPHALFAFRLLIRALRCEVFALVDQRIDRVVFQLDLLLARVGIAQRI